MKKPNKVRNPSPVFGKIAASKQKSAVNEQPPVRYMTPEEAHVTTEKIMRVHHDVLRRLAEHDRS